MRAVAQVVEHALIGRSDAEFVIADGLVGLLTTLVVGALSIILHLF